MANGEVTNIDIHLFYPANELCLVIELYLLYYADVGEESYNCEGKHGTNCYVSVSEHFNSAIMQTFLNF